jgi:hypothetical protein
MNDQSHKGGDARQRHGKSELLERIHISRSALEETLGSLSEEQLTRHGPEGWSIKDHLAHIAVWELGIVELLNRRPRFEAMGVEEAISGGKDQDEINDLIYRRHAGLSLGEVLEMFQSSHRQMLKTLNTLSDDDLYKPYSSYVPDGNDDRHEPVIGWIVGNTFGHFDEHHEYIKDLIGG